MTYTLPSLPTDIDATFPDRSPGDAEHQQHHDAIHRAFADLDSAGGVVVPADIQGLGGAPTQAEVETYAAANTKGGAEKVAAGSATTGTATLDCSAASWFTVTPTGNITLAPSNIPAAGTACTLTVEITMGATAYTVTYPAGTKHSGGTALAPAASKTLLITIATRDGGSTWLASEALFS